MFFFQPMNMVLILHPRWDKTANGYARGEGLAALILKPLSAALRDGDHVEGVIRATGVNSDGQSPGITMPFAPAQTALMRRTYLRAGLDPLRDPPQYFECHGTGTQAGDPVEARAVFDAFYRDGETGEVKAEPQTLHVGSVKTVIGHLEGCAGLAGVFISSLARRRTGVSHLSLMPSESNRSHEGAACPQAPDHPTKHALQRA